MTARRSLEMPVIAPGNPPRSRSSPSGIAASAVAPIGRGATRKPDAAASYCLEHHTGGMRESLLFPSWWLAKPDLQDGEHVAWSVPANRTQGGRAVGGKLLLTEQRLIFTPNRVEVLTHGRRWECKRAVVESVGTLDRTGGPFDGGLVRRVRIDHDGSVDLFVVPRPEEVAVQLRALLAVPPSPA